MNNFRNYYGKVLRKIAGKYGVLLVLNCVLLKVVAGL